MGLKSNSKGFTSYVVGFVIEERWVLSLCVCVCCFAPLESKVFSLFARSFNDNLPNESFAAKAGSSLVIIDVTLR